MAHGLITLLLPSDALLAMQVKLDKLCRIDTPPPHHIQAVQQQVPSDVADSIDKGDLAPSSRFWRPFLPAVAAMSAFSAAKSPCEKRDLLILTAKLLFQCVVHATAPAKTAGEKSVAAVDADNMLGLFAYVSLHSQARFLFSQVRVALCF